MLGAIEDIVRRGRARGLGVTMITQRPSVLNKNVLTQIEVLVALRLTAPLDQKAVDEWVKTNAEEGQREEFLTNIGSLDIGTAYFWSPGWLKIFKKVKVRRRKTLDSSSTPVAGQEVVKPEKMAEVNLQAIRDQLGAAVEEVESNDPKALKKKIKELEAELAKKPKPVETVEIPVIPDHISKSIFKMASELKEIANTLEEILIDEAKKLTPTFKEIREKNEGFAKGGIITNPGPILVGEHGIENLLVPGISKYAGSLLHVFKQRYPMQVSRSQLAILSGRKPRSSAFGAAIAELISAGYVQNDDGRYELTKLATDNLDLNNFAEKPNAQDIRSMWLNALPTYERDLLNVILQHRDGITKNDLARQSGRSITSSGFGGAISTLKKNGLVFVKDDKISPAETFYEGNK